MFLHVCMGYYFLRRRERMAMEYGNYANYGNGTAGGVTSASAGSSASDGTNNYMAEFEEKLRKNSIFTLTTLSASANQG